jgi:hypothetical protein
MQTSPSETPHAAPKNRLMRFLAIATALLLLPIFVLGATVAATGTVSVSVQEHGGHSFYIPMPALLVDLAVLAAPAVIPEDELAEMRREIAPYRDHLETLAEELESMPSGLLVEVETPTEHVRITKEWRSFRVEVESEDADITVSVPARLLSRSLDVI